MKHGIRRGCQYPATSVSYKIYTFAEGSTGQSLRTQLDLKIKLDLGHSQLMIREIVFE